MSSRPKIADAKRVLKKLNGDATTLKGKRYIQIFRGYPSKRDAQQLFAFNHVVSLAIDASRNGSVEGLQLLLQEWHETLCSVRIVKCKKLGTIGESIAQLGKLTELDLDECIIDTSLANAISHLSQLKSIQMKNCQLTARNAELIFNGCTNVEKIYIHEPKLALKDLDSILKLKKMKSFWYN